MTLFDENRPKTNPKQHILCQIRETISAERKNWPSLDLLQPCVIKAMQLMMWEYTPITPGG